MTFGRNIQNGQKNFACFSFYVGLLVITLASLNKKAVLPQGNRAMLQVFFSVEVRQQHSLQV